MNVIKTAVCALAVAGALVAGRAMASGNGGLLLNVSGTVKYQVSLNGQKAATATRSFSEKIIYLVISNALANPGTNAIASTNLPKDGYIVYDPEGYDSNGTVYVQGKFYAAYKTDKTNEVRIPLSGFDTNNNYYSFMELDTMLFYANTNEPEYSDLNLGFFYQGNNLFDGVESYDLNKTGSGPDTSTSKAMLYIHDNPYAFGDLTGNDFYDGSPGYNSYPFEDNNGTAFEIGGILTASLAMKDNDIDHGGISVNGTGNFALFNAIGGVVTSGHASFTDYKP